MFTQKIEAQPKASTSPPPISGPTPCPAQAIAIQMATARGRSSGGNPTATIASEVGRIAADHEHQAPAVEVAGPPTYHDQGSGQEVGADRPLERVHRVLELAADRRQGDVDVRRGQPDEEGESAEPDQRPPPVRIQRTPVRIRRPGSAGVGRGMVRGTGSARRLHDPEP
jgi:hypothetical protein